MFAVPGWSVSAEALKAESAPSGDSAAGAKSKKRKRAGASSSQSVTASNVADLYESVVEGKDQKVRREAKSASAAKKQKKGDDERREGKPGKKQGEKPARVKRDDLPEPEKGTPAQEKKDKKDKKSHNNKDDKKRKSSQHGGDDDVKQPVSTTNDTSKDAEATPAKAKPSPKPKQQLQQHQQQPPPQAAKLTPLQASMREKLVSARFRHLNETLYTRPSGEAFRLFDESPEMFDEYHEGFRRQVRVWPENPVDSFLADIRARARARQPGKGRSGGGAISATPRARTPLPRTAGQCTVADLGCGDARLAESLQGECEGLRLDVRSFDLQSPSPLVTRADIADLPLADGSVNVAIFCLALMGTNWLDFVDEAYRVLHWKGELWVAEIKSRFVAPSRGGPGGGKGQNVPVEHSVGNRRRQAAPGAAPLSKKAKAARDAEAEALDGQDLAVHVDGQDDHRRQTDVSAFVEALRRRGFVLHGERDEAIDLSNRMFVKMHFIKGATPTEGKAAKPQEPRKTAKGASLKWTSEDVGAKGSVEAVILKPCVYKIR